MHHVFECDQQLIAATCQKKKGWTLPKLILYLQRLLVEPDLRLLPAAAREVWCHNGNGVAAADREEESEEVQRGKYGDRMNNARNRGVPPSNLFFYPFFKIRSNHQPSSAARVERN
jgi:hypothetical protein